MTITENLDVLIAETGALLRKCELAWLRIIPFGETVEQRNERVAWLSDLLAHDLPATQERDIEAEEHRLGIKPHRQD